MPTYLTSIVGFDLQHSGAIAVLPYLACFIGSIVFGWHADALINGKGGNAGADAEPSSEDGADMARRIARVRSGMSVVAEVLPAVCLTVAANLTSAPLIVALLTAALGFSGASSASFASTYIDIAPRNAGVVLGLGNTIATVSGVIAPIVVGQLISGSDPASKAQGWKNAFYIAAAVAALGSAFYARFLSATPLPFWDVAGRSDGGREESEDGGTDAAENE